MGNSEKIKEQLEKFREAKTSATDKIADIKDQAKESMDKELFSIMRTLIKKEGLDFKVVLEKDSKNHKWVFNVSFDESDMINDKEIALAVTEVKNIFIAAELPKEDNPILYKGK